MFQASVLSLGFSPDGQRLVATTGNLDASSISPFLAGRGLNVSDRRIQVFRVKDRKHLKDLKNPTDLTDVASVAGFSADGKRIFSASPNDGKLRVWNWDESDGANLGKEIMSIQVGPNYLDKNTQIDKGDTRQLTAVGFWPWGRVVTGYRHGGIKLWDLGTGKQIGPPLGWPSPSKTGDAYVTALAISPDGHHALAALSDSLIYLFKLPPPGARQ
jgi:WD40 repeat protein